MAKKYKSNKLIKKDDQPVDKPASAFGKFANRLADAKKKKIQKLSDTQKRLLETKKNNKMIKISKKAKKFALLDLEDQNAQGTLNQSLTHKGVNIRDLKDYDDINFNESDLQNDDQFDQIQDKMNFAGFQATDNLMEQRQAEGGDDRQKTKTQIYKQIIEKSKAYKMFRQQQYEQNLNMATQLDQGFGEFVSQLKFRNRDQKLHDKLEHRDPEYEKLMNQLRDDERIVSNKIVQKNQKHTEKIRQKKNEQLNKLLKDSDGQEGDVRGWVDGQEEEVSVNQSYNDEQNEDEQQDAESQPDENGQNQQEEGSYDELDDVNLSSDEENQDEQDDQEEQINQVAQSSDNQVDEQSQDQQNEAEQDSYDEQESQQVVVIKKNKNKSAQNGKKQSYPSLPTKQNNQAKVSIAKGNPQKKRKLNTIY